MLQKWLSINEVHWQESCSGGTNGQRSLERSCWKLISYLSQGAVTSPPPVRAIVHNVTMVATETRAKSENAMHSLLTRHRFAMAITELIELLAAPIAPNQWDCGLPLGDWMFYDANAKRVDELERNTSAPSESQISYGTTQTAAIASMSPWLTSPRYSTTQSSNYLEWMDDILGQCCPGGSGGNRW